MKRVLPLCLLLVAGRLLAADAPVDSDGEAASRRELMALMEFIGEWESSDGEWIDALSLDSTDATPTDSGEDHEQ